MTRMHHDGVLISMRTTLIIKDELLKRASELTGIEEKAALVYGGLEAPIARKTGYRLAAMGDTIKNIKVPLRRCPDFSPLSRAKKAG